MKIERILEEGQDWYLDWQKRKGWTSELAGPFTTQEEDKAAQLILLMSHKLKELKWIRRKR